ncbi:diguanylate cyclase, partial [bacterium]
MGESGRTLADAEADLERVERVASVGSFTWDFATGTVRWSAQTYRLLGLEPHTRKAGFEALAEVLPAEEVKRMRARLERELATGICEPFEHPVTLPDGATRIVRVDSELERGGDGKILRMVGAIRDVTEQRRQ